MFRLRRINRQYIVTYENVDYIFAHHQHAWAFILTIRKDTMK
jgi:hypothetical protein